MKTSCVEISEKKTTKVLSHSGTKLIVFKQRELSYYLKPEGTHNRIEKFLGSVKCR